MAKDPTAKRLQEHSNLKYMVCLTALERARDKLADTNFPDPGEYRAAVLAEAIRDLTERYGPLPVAYTVEDLTGTRKEVEPPAPPTTPAPPTEVPGSLFYDPLDR